MRSAHPNAKFRSITALYNCVGHVFGSRRTCIDTSWIFRILYEDEYRKLKSEAELAVGDLVVYRYSGSEPSHVGVVQQISPSLADATWTVTVLSKWGADAEYLHDVRDVPVVFGVPEYWTERKAPNDD
jgi:hypothetical protein